MRFILAAASCAALLSGPASGTPVPATGDVNPTIPASQQDTVTGRIVSSKNTFNNRSNGLTYVQGDDGVLIIEPEPVTTKLVRRAVPVVVVGIVGTAAASIIAKIAIEIGADTIKNLGEFNEVCRARYLLCHVDALKKSLTSNPTGPRGFYQEDHPGDVGSKPGLRKVPCRSLL